MKESKTPLWKKSCLKGLRFSDIREYLEEISENGDPYGYDYGEEGYYNEYKDQFDELSAGAWDLLEAISEANDVMGYDEDNSIWDDITVSVLGPIYQVLGYDGGEYDYYAMVNGYEEDLAVEEARKRLSRLTKADLIYHTSKVMQCVALFWDIKAAHDCLVSIVEELDDRAAIMKSGQTVERMWVE